MPRDHEPTKKGRLLPNGLKGPVALDAPPIPANEPERMRAVLDLNVQDFGDEPELIALRDAAQRLLGVQSAVISTIETGVMRVLTGRTSPERDRAGGPAIELGNFEIPRDRTLCQSTIMEPDHLVIPDAERFIVSESGSIFPEDFRDQTAELGGYPTPWPQADGTMGFHGSRFYAAAPIRSSSGLNLGSFCVMDEEQRPEFGPPQVAVLQQLARLAAEFLERRALLERPPNFRLLQRLRAPVVEPPAAEAAAEAVDVVVVGGGPAGTTAACRLAFRGQQVVLVEPQEHFGAPTGVTSKIFREAALRYGSDAAWDDVVALRDAIGTQEAHRVRAMLERYGVRIVRGRAHFEALDEPDEAGRRTELVTVEREEGPPLAFRANATVMATGSRGRRLADLPFDGERVFDADSIGAITRKPRSLLVQGGGLIAVEYAMIFARMGVPVTMAVRCGRDEMLPNLDRSLASALLLDVDRLGIELLCQTSLVEARQEAQEVLVGLEQGQERIERAFDVVLSAVGRSPNLSGLGLDALYEGQMPLEGGAPPIDDRQHLREVPAAVYAVGDVSGGPGLACHAVLQAQRAVDDLLPLLVNGTVLRPPFTTAPGARAPQPASVVWTVPEIAFAGESEEHAVETWGAAEVIAGTARFAESVRGTLIDTPSHWFVKLVCLRRDGRVLGVHLYGEGASELVHYGADLVNDAATVFELQYRIFPAVTLHEVYRVVANNVIEKLVAEARGVSEPTAGDDRA